MTVSSTNSGQQAAAIQQAMQLALEHHQAGRLAEAERIYRQALEMQPDHPGALHFLGLIALQSGDSRQAADLLEQARRIEPSSPALLINLGTVYRGLGRPGDAESRYRAALALSPDHPEAHNNRGTVLRDTGRLQDAEQSFRRALAHNPGHIEAHDNLGKTLIDLQRPAEAEEYFRRTIALKPGHAEAHHVLGTLLRGLGRFDESERSLRRAIELNPDSAAMRNSLAAVLNDLGQLQEAAQRCREALILKPGYAPAHSNLGVILTELGQTADAERSLRQALALDPGFAEAHGHLAHALKAAGRLAEAERACRQALALRPDFADVHSNFIFLLDLLENRGIGEQQEERRRWYVQHGEKHAESIGRHDNSPEPGRKLRIGYVSADFFLHSAYFAFSPVIYGHDRSAFEVVCYSGVKHEDAATARLRRALHFWRSTVGMPDAALAEQIRGDRIDILVDLSGHSAGNRLAVFARKPAPVQVTAWGHATGTGLQTIDYFFADPIFVPTRDRALFAEEVIDLPCVICYEAPAYAPDVSPLPALSGKSFTFGCGVAGGQTPVQGPQARRCEAPGRFPSQARRSRHQARAGAARRRLVPCRAPEDLSRGGRGAGSVSPRRRGQHRRGPMDGGAGCDPARTDAPKPPVGLDTVGGRPAGMDRE
jgi:protein O-GlcNAc transferase